MRPIIAFSTALPGWTRLWLSLMLLLSPLSIAAATLGDWDADTNRMIVATTLLALTALAFFLLSLALRLHLALVSWIIAGFDLQTHKAFRRYLWPLLRAVLTVLVVGFCLFWLRDTMVARDHHAERGSFCRTTTTSIEFKER